MSVGFAAVAIVAATSTVAPMKLVIVAGQGGGVAVVDYPAAEKCQRAARVVEAEWRARFAEAKERAKADPSYVVTGPAFVAFAFCIPG